MPLEYEPAPASTERLRQGQLLRGIVEFRSNVAHTVDEPSLEVLEHPLAVVLTADCDLEQDFNARSEPFEAGNRRILPGVLFCDLFQEEQIRPDFVGLSDIWKRAVHNQDERYHCLGEALVAGSNQSLPKFLLDFKRTMIIPSAAVYGSLAVGAIVPVACVSGEYLYDLMHRFFTFQSRIGVN